MCTPQVGTLSTSLVVGMSMAKEMLHTRMTNTIVLPYGALMRENEADMPMASGLKGIGLNVVVLPRKTLYVLQDRVAAKLRAKEGRALQVMSEQQINIENLSLQQDDVVAQNLQLVQVIEEAFQMVSELAIQAKEPAEARIWKLATGVHEVREEMDKL